MEAIMVRTNITPTPATVNNQILVNNNNPNNPTPRQGLDIPVIPTNQTTTTPVVRPRGRVQEVQGWTPAQPTRPCLLTSATWAAEVCHTHYHTPTRVRTRQRRLRRDTRTFTRWDERELIRFSEIPVTITHTPVILFMFVVILLSSKYTSAAHSTTRIFTKITLRFIPKNRNHPNLACRHFCPSTIIFVCLCLILIHYFMSIINREINKSVRDWRQTSCFNLI